VLAVKKRIEKDGRIELGDLLKSTKIKPGDWVEIIPSKNKIIIQISKRAKPKGAIRAAAGILKNQPELVEEMLLTREAEDDRTGTSL